MSARTSDASSRGRREMRGMSLVELMVAMTIGIILLGGALTLFINNRDTYNITNELSRLQETARFSLGMMIKDIRMAGYFGCARNRDNLVENFGAADTELWNPTWPIEGLDDEGVAEFLPSNKAMTVGSVGDDGEILAGTDAITLRYAAGNLTDAAANGTPDYQVTSDVSNGAGAAVVIDSTAGFQVDEVVTIADCGSAEVFQITAVPDGVTLTANSLTRSYNAANTPMVAPYVGVRYYIGDNGRGPGGATYPSLYRAVIIWDGAAFDERHDELFEGVESMQLLYGVDEDNDGAPDRYVRAGAAPLDVDDNWMRVVSVRIGLLVRTVDEYGRDDDDKLYDVNDKVDLGPFNDRRRRRVFTTTAMVRNLQ